MEAGWINKRPHGSRIPCIVFPGTVDELSLHALGFSSKTCKADGTIVLVKQLVPFVVYSWVDLANIALCRFSGDADLLAEVWAVWFWKTANRGEHVLRSASVCSIMAIHVPIDALDLLSSGLLSCVPTLFCHLLP